MKRIAVGSCELSGWQNKIALARADLIAAYLDEKALAKTQGRSMTEAAKYFLEGYNTGHKLPDVFKSINTVKRSTIDAWCKTFRASGHDYMSLAPQWGARAGQSKLTEIEFNTLLSFALHPNRLRIAECVRHTKKSLRQRGIESLSSSATLQRALKKWKTENNDKWVFCREGEKSLNDKCLPYLERDASRLEVGDVLVADGHTLNFQILHPLTGRPCRMTMVMWMDWASRYPCGWEIMPTENVQCIASGFRRAIIALGKIPKIAYLDNGKAFKAKIFTDTNIDFEQSGFYGMFARGGTSVVFTLPYNAQSKIIEREFQTFGELERMMPAYTGTDIEHKPAHLLRNEKLHKKLHIKKYGGWVPTIEQVHAIIDGWVKEYASRPHKGLKGLCPGDVFKAGRGPGVDRADLRHLMMSIEMKNANRNGVSFMGRNYYDEALYGIKDRVTIRYDLADLSSIEIYDVTGARHICTARPREQLHPMARLLGKPEDLAAVKAHIAQKRRLKKQTESVARAFVENSPDLIQIPDLPGAIPAMPRVPEKLPRAEAEHIEAQASRMKVIELKAPDPIFQSAAAKYEYLIELECSGNNGGLTDDQRSFCRQFEGTQEYKILQNRYDFIREISIERNCGTEVSSG